MPKKSEDMDRSEFGLVATGTVVRRTKRMIGATDPSEVVTYTLAAGERMLQVDVWRPHSYEPVGTTVSFHVTNRAYINKNGAVISTLSAVDDQASF